jgi:hypothetical protein
MARKCLWFLAILFIFSFAAAPVLACHKNGFGPKYLKIKRWHFHLSAHRFTVDEPGEGTLIITKKNRHRKIRRGFVCLNGRFYPLHHFVRKGERTMEKTVRLRRRNYLFVFLFGARSACIQVEVRKKLTPVNQPPLAADQSIGTDEDTPTVITLQGSDPDGDPLTFHVLSDPAKGTLSGTPPDLTYTPDANYNGSDSFTFKANDGKRDSDDAATVTILVHPLNDSPEAESEFVKTDEDSALLITLKGSDVDGDSLSYTVQNPPAHGALSGSPPALTYLPESNFNGSDAFTFMVNDGKDSSLGQIDIDVSPVNDPPIAHAALAKELYYVGDDVLLDGSGSEDVDGDALTYHWAFTDCPMDPAPELASTANPSFVPYVADLYGLALTVHDGVVESPQADTVAFLVQFAPFEFSETQLPFPQGAKGDHFGASVSIHGDRAMVSAPDAGAAYGAAYIFEHNSPWTEAATLKPQDGAAGDRFGASVCLTEDLAIAGASGDDGGMGSAYVYRYALANWIEEQKLAPADGEPGDQFGASVAIQENLAAVGAPRDDLGGDAWVSHFGKDQYDPKPGAWLWWSGLSQRWESYNSTFELLLTDSLGFRPIAVRLSHTSLTPIEHFSVLDEGGNPLAERAGYASGDPVPLPVERAIAEIQAWKTIAITNIEFLPEGAGEGDVDAGSAYVFRYDGAAWKEEAQLTAGDGEAGDHFGASVSLSDKSLIVGADLDDEDPFTDSGSAYVFIYYGTAWTEQAKLVAEDSGDHRHFGASVTLDGDVAVVGAPGAGEAGQCPGAAYVFVRDGDIWTQEARLTAGDGDPGDRFGASVSLSGRYLVVGAPNAGGSGAAYLFRRDGSAWTEEGKITAGDAEAGKHFGASVAMSGDQVIAGAPGEQGSNDEAGAAYVYTIESYHTVTLTADREVISEGESSDLSIEWAPEELLKMDTEPDLGLEIHKLPPTQSVTVSVSPEETTTYTITTTGRYGMDTASVTVTVTEEIEDD